MCITNVNDAALRLLEVKETLKALEAEKEALTDFLKAAMNLNQEDTLSGDGWEANRQRYNITRFDATAFQAEHADLYGEYSKKAPQTRFTIKATVKTVTV